MAGHTGCHQQLICHTSFFKTPSYVKPSYPEAQNISIDFPKEMPLSLVEVMVKEGQELEGVMAVLPLMRVQGHSFTNT
jgi:hypothetical protein